MKALLLLYRLHIASIFRRMFSGLKTIKGIFMALFFAFMGLSMLAPLAMKLFSEKQITLGFDPEPYFPFLLLAYFLYSLLSSVGERALLFSPAEIDHLFPAPFHRKQLLAYKIAGWALMSAFSGLFFALAFSMYTGGVVYTIVGFAITIFFMMMASMLVTLIGQIVSEQLFTSGRKTVALILLVMFAMAMSQAAMQIDVNNMAELRTWFDTVANSTAGKIVLAPFQVFSNIVFAKSFAGFASSLAIASVIVLGTVTGIMMLDANYLETATSVSEKLYAKMERMKAGQTTVSKKSTAWKLNMFPFLQGYGPVAWRQAMTILRQSRQTIVIGAIISIAAGIPFVLGFTPDFANTEAVVGMGFGVMAYIAFIISMAMPHGFRSDIDHIEVFKSLPLKPFSIAAGQITGPILMLILLHTVMTIVCIFITRNFISWWIAGYLFIVVFDILLSSVANGLFLMFPTRQSGGTKAMEAIPQNLIMMFLQGLMFSVVIGISLLPAALVYFLSGSLFAAGATAWILFFACAIGSIFFTGWAYARYDVANTPK